MLKKKRVIQKTIAILFALIVCIPMMMNGMQVEAASGFTDSFTATFDYNNGTGKTKNVYWRPGVGLASEIGGLNSFPEITEADYPSDMSVFDGWFLVDSNGNMTTTEVTEDWGDATSAFTAKAKWSTNAYEITIPAVTSVSSSDNTGKVEFTGKLASAKKLSVDVTSKNDWKLVSGSYGLGYTMDNDAFSYENDESSILNFSDAINITVNDKATIAGDFEDTLTFSMHVEDVVYTLQNGIDFNKNIPSTATAVEFTTEAMPSTVTDYTDVSEAQDGSILAYLDGTTLKVSPKVSGMKIYANENCKEMFSEKSKLTSIKFDNFDTSNVTNMLRMFESCERLTTLDLNNFDTSNVENMAYMFHICSSLTELDVSKFDTSNVINMSSMFGYCDSLTSLDTSNFNTSKVTNMSGMFYDCSSLTSLDLTDFNTSSVIDMNGMFNKCSSLSSLTFDTSKFTTDNVTNMQYMFNGCSSLTSLDVSKFDTSNVVYMYSMFDNCSSLTSLDVSNFNTEKVTSMSGLFSGCKSLTKLDVSNFKTSKVTNMFYMFNGCSGLTDLDVTRFDTSSVTNMEAMFGGCSGLTSLNLTKFNTAKVTSMKNMLNGCSNLTSIDLSSFDTSKVTSYDYMFADCKKLAEITVGNLWAKSVTFPNTGVSSAGKWYAISDGSEYQYNAIPTSKADTYVVSKTLTITFDAGDGTFDDSSSTNTYLYDITTASVTGTYKKPTSSDSNKTFIGWSTKADATEAEYKADGSDIPTNGNKTLYAVYQTAVTLQKGTDFNQNIPSTTTAVEFTTEAMPSTVTDYTDVSEAQDGSILAYMDGTTLKVSPKDAGAKIYANENCYNMFNTSSYSGGSKTQANLVSITFDNFNTSNVTNMNNMFYNCGSLTSLDLSKFDTSNTTNMRMMFYNCYKLTLLDTTKFDTSNVTDMSDMFGGCSRLTSLDLTKFNTANVTNMSEMFDNCRSLTSLNLSNFNTSKVTNMEYMFYNCSSLTSLDVTKFDTSNVKSMSGMFSGDEKLETIYVSIFSTDNVTSSSNMFNSCTSLVGGNGTKYDSSHRDKLYARGDGGNSYPGYFTVIFTNDILFNANGGVFDDGSDISTSFKTPSPKEPTNIFVGWSTNSNAITPEYEKNCSNIPADGSLILYAVYQSWTFDWEYTIEDNYVWLHKYIGKETDYTIPASATIDAVTYTTKIGKWNDNISAQLNTGVIENLKFESGIKTSNSFKYLFLDNYNIKKIDFTRFDTSSITDMTGMFKGCKYLAELNVSDFNTSNVISMDGMFNGCNTLSNLDVQSFDTSNVTSMNCMFAWCSSIKSLNLNNFKTSEVTDMIGMFWGCSSLTSLDLSKFDTSKVTNMRYMLATGSSSMLSKSSLVSVNLSNFNTSNVTDMSYMFYTSSSLTSLDLNSFNTEKVSDMSNMFEGCKSLTSLDLSKFDTSKVLSMSKMFNSCSKLVSLDLSNFNTSNVRYMDTMFGYCSKLTVIYESNNFTIGKNTQYTSQIFQGCTSLVGGNGTKYDSSHVDATYARIDTSSTPGYFTLKSSDEEQSDIDIVNIFNTPIDDVAEDSNNVEEAEEKVSLEKTYTADDFSAEGTLIESDDVDTAIETTATPVTTEGATGDENASIEADEQASPDSLNACVTPAPSQASASEATPASSDTATEETSEASDEASVEDATNNGVSGDVSPESSAPIYSLNSDDDLNALISLHPTMIRFEGVSVTDEMPEYDESVFDVEYDEESRTLTIEVVGEYADGAEGTSTEEQLLDLVYSGMFAEIDDEVKVVVEFDASVMEDEKCASVMGEIESFGVRDASIGDDVRDTTIGDDDIEVIDDSTTGASIGDDIEATPEATGEPDIEA